MSIPDHTSPLHHAVEHMRGELYVIQQQLLFLADLTVGERDFTLTTQAETFSVTMRRLSEEIGVAMEYAEGLKEYRQI